MSGPEQERRDVAARLGEAAGLLERSMDPSLLHPGGSNIACAIRGARDGRDVAAVSGGLRADHGSVRCAGPVAFGADPAAARAILTVMKFDPAVRSGAAIRFSDDAWRILSALFIECAETDPAKHHDGISTMDWAIASCCSDGVPDVIALHGRTPETSVIWMLDEEPVKLASNIIILSNRI